MMFGDEYDIFCARPGKQISPGVRVPTLIYTPFKRWLKVRVGRITIGGGVMACCLAARIVHGIEIPLSVGHFLARGIVK